MAYDIGPKIGIEGEKAFRQAINDINTNMRTLKTEMQAVSSQFDKNEKSQESYTAKNEVLNKQIEEQKKKLEELTKGLQMSADKYGENDKVTQGWQQAVNKATAELNDMERELDGNTKAMDELGNETEKTGSRFEKFGGILKGVAVAAGAVAVAAGAAAVKLGKEVIAGFADYEQLVGGVDTLFKDSSQKLQDYANNAYKTAGLSANDYMETVTSFSASLIQSLGGDTEKAVKYADMAITDMSDNANKMGTDMSAIQNAYQGFSKMNYTMLDNLKLGYGGTKQEMERLLADAEKISGIKYDISSYADVVDAIHVMQVEMGIAGATALEAESTISGSANAMKSAWENWIVGLGNSNADMTNLTQNLVDAFQNVVTNVVPIIENITAALPLALAAILPAVGELLPTLLTTFSDLFSQVLEAILTMLPGLIPAGVAALMTVVEAIIANLPLILDVAIQVIMALVEGLVQTLPELVPATVEIITTLVTKLTELIPQLIPVALEMIIALARGIIDSLPKIIEVIPQIIDAIVRVITENLPEIVLVGFQIIVALAGALVENIPTILKAIIEIIGSMLKGLINGIVQLVTFIPRLFSALIGEIGKIKWGELGKNIINGIGEGIKNAAKNLADGVVSAAKGALDSAKRFLGIKSPSTVMRDQVGKMIGAGMAAGIVDSAREVDAAMNGLNRKLDVNANVGVNGNSSSGSSASRSLVEHTGIIRVEGVSDDNQVFTVVDIVLDELRREARI